MNKFILIFSFLIFVIILPFTVYAEQQTETYILVTSTGKFHHTWCYHLNQVLDENKVTKYSTVNSLISYGYTPCSYCIDEVSYSSNSATYNSYESRSSVNNYSSSTSLDSKSTAEFFVKQAEETRKAIIAAVLISIIDIILYFLIWYFYQEKIQFWSFVLFAITLGVCYVVSLPIGWLLSSFEDWFDIIFTKVFKNTTFLYVGLIGYSLWLIISISDYKKNKQPKHIKESRTASSNIKNSPIYRKGYSDGRAFADDFAMLLSENQKSLINKKYDEGYNKGFEEACNQNQEEWSKRIKLSFQDGYQKGYEDAKREYSSARSLEERFEVPEGIEIHNLMIRDTMYKGKYGRYTGYITENGKTVHLKEGCSGARCPVLLFDESRLIGYNRCLKCFSIDKFYLFRVPEWYIKFKKYKIEELNQTKNDVRYSRRNKNSDFE